ncbi:MAG: tRNA uridine-5-carboxymethylaminomethyl(34) synthesis enzyme MnmG [Deltaproteobacteria bacterium]|nr:tRNA uridine-5-carboxymethylaminomethyl(34) synthesis enzyme MnmG [Deltaproteobacteria bacterium]
MKFSVLVVGGGHAGIEAACVSARLGLSTVMVTLDKKKIGEMSCNPAIGGVGKGQLVKEIDILGGLMGEAIDSTGIQFRTLNASRGCSIKSTRAQADRFLYQKWMQNRVETYQLLTVVEDEVERLIVSNERIRGVQLKSLGFIETDAVVITTGTFLRGLMHQGENKTIGGRYGDKASWSLTESLKDLGFELIRLKTGTPPRLLLKSIDFSKCHILAPDSHPKPFSFWSRGVKLPQIPCWITKTNQLVHEIIAENKHRSPIFNGQIKSVGPRYCPSIEDKVVRFSEKSSHQIFLEPEGLDSELVYPNGISTSLPIDVQDRFVRLIDGLENVVIVRYGYAVEYDAVQPTQLKHSLESKSIKGLFLAGQINGTSGYEEAGAQGILAGINAAMYALQREPLIVGRHQGYIGVMVDDLVTLGVEEPYRMFTSRVEFRLSIREDNAFARLGPLALKLGLLSPRKARNLNEALEQYDEISKESASIKVLVNDRVLLSLKELAKRADLEIDVEEVLAQIQSRGISVEKQVLESVLNDIKLEGYLARHEKEKINLERLENIKIPSQLDYSSIPGLRKEFSEKFSRIKPETLGQASRIPGVTPACLALLEVYILKKYGSKVASYS